MGLGHWRLAEAWAQPSWTACRPGGLCVGALALLAQAAGAQDLPPGPLSDRGSVRIAPAAAADASGTADGEAAGASKLGKIVVRGRRGTAVGPLPGSTLTKDEIPGNVQSLSAEQIKNAHALSLTDLLNSELQSVNVNDYQGNPFQMDVTYRGFTASPQLGTSQGLSVFLDGIRVNEPFGDVVNWDMIPMNALAGFDVFPGSNPIFGLGTLGGALAMRTKNGFDHPGVEAELLGGSFGRKQLQISAGRSGEDTAGFFAASLFDERGWRDNSPSKVNQLFGKLSYREGRLELDGSGFLAANKLVGNGLVPTEMYQRDAGSVFSSPDRTRNELLQFQLAGAFAVSDGFSVTGQVYRRRSNRRSTAGDINTNLGGAATRRARPGENPVCAYPDANRDGIIDYHVVTQDVPDGFGGFTSRFEQAANAVFANGGSNADADAAARATLDPGSFNQALPAYYADHVQAVGQEMQYYNYLYAPAGTPRPFQAPLPVDANGSPVGGYSVSYLPDSGTGSTNNYFYGPDGLRRFIVAAPPLNEPCGVSRLVNRRFQLPYGDPQPGEQLATRDGALDPRGNTNAGVVDGTPVAIISEGEIAQRTQGGALQLNWDLERHKLMAGVSIDDARSSYANCERLGLFDAQRQAYLDPDHIGEEFAAATQCVRNNDFSGRSRTRSLYLSETYSPTPALHFNVSARYNHTQIDNTLKARANNSEVEIADYLNSYLRYMICPGGTLASCDPTLLTQQGPFNVGGFSYNGDPSAPFVALTTKETPSYRSLNPAAGATWSLSEDLNVYGNWSQGTRTPSVIELGCAFDRTPVRLQGGQWAPRSLVDRSACNLPNSLSGDPYLKQVTARTLEFGLRGNLGTATQWNLTAYRSNVLDDIYLVGFTPTQSFFDTIPKTRRQGLEMGFSGVEGRSDFKLNYSYTQATIESTSNLVSAFNSTAGVNVSRGDYAQIVVNPGDRLPGVPQHNVNASLGYLVTDRWHVGLKMVAHSGSFVRGNENNQHQPGVSREVVYDREVSPGVYATTPTGQTTPLSQYPGRTPGYAVVNFKTSYRFEGGLSLTLLVNNLFDRRYFSAGRLGINPFSPSVNGAIGVSGFNYNSNDWLGTNLVAPGAPRAGWIALSYELK